MIFYLTDGLNNIFNRNKITGILILIRNKIRPLAVPEAPY